MNNRRMSFEEWYDSNKERFVNMTTESALKYAYSYGFMVATEEMYKAVIDGLRGEEFRNKPGK